MVFLYDAWISRFGLPEHITSESDRGSVFTYLVIAGSAARSKPTPHNVIPPSDKRNGGEMVQNIESITYSEMFNFGLVQPTLGSFGAPYHAQRQSNSVFCRNGLRSASGRSWRILPLIKLIKTQPQINHMLRRYGAL